VLLYRLVARVLCVVVRDVLLCSYWLLNMLIWFPGLCYTLTVVGYCFFFWPAVI